MSLILFGALVLAGVVGLLIFQLSESSKADKEREYNRRAVDVNGALTCERVQRGQPPPSFQDELDAKGYVTISPHCQRYVQLLGEDLVYENGRVLLRTSEDGG